MKTNKCAFSLLKYLMLFCILLTESVYSNEFDLFSLQEGKFDIAIEQGAEKQKVSVSLFHIDEQHNDYQYQLFYKKTSHDKDGLEVVKSDIRDQALFSIKLETLYAYEVAIAVIQNNNYLYRTPIEKIKPGDFLTTNAIKNTTHNHVFLSNTLAANSSGLNSTLKIYSDSFPFVFLEAAIDFNGIPYDGDPNNLPLLTKDNFTITEDGRLQSIVGVTPPSGQSSGKKIADILFVHDDSGSLGDEAAQVKANITSFVNQLASNNIDFRIGLLPYGGGGGFSTPSGTLLNGGLLHDNTSSFINDIDSMRFDGGTERAFDAMHLGATQTNWRQSTQKIIILITDENNDSGSINESTVTQALKDNGVTVYGLTRGHSEFDRIATATNGKVFNITADFSSILADIGNTIGASYVVRYKTDNPNLDGQKRSVEVNINAKDQQAVAQTTTVTGEYTANPPVGIILTPQTQALGSKGQREGASLPIFAKITRNGIVDTAINASLFFKQANDSSYDSVSMKHVNNGLYFARIPSNVIFEPFVSYYISASDGTSTTTNPSSDPGSNPVSISILPNTPPSVQHLPLFSAEENKEILISAVIEDVTNQVDSASVYYRKAGEVIYQEIGASFGKPSVSFSNIIPATATQNTEFVEYYIEAKDDFGVKGTYGSADNPIRVYIARTKTASAHRDVENIRVYADSFLDQNGDACKETGFVLCTASGNVSVGTKNGDPILSFEASLQLQEVAKKIISNNSGRIIALNIKKNVSRSAENIPLYESNIEIDASDPLQDAVMKISGGQSLLQLLGTVNLRSQTSLVTIKDDEIVIHNVLADIDQYIPTLVDIGDVSLSQIGNSMGPVTVKVTDTVDVFLPEFGKTKWSFPELELTLDLINSAISGKAKFDMEGKLKSVEASLGFLTNPFALENIGGKVETPNAVFTIPTPLSPLSPLGAGFNSFSLDVSNISSSTAPKIKATGGFKLTDFARLLEGAEEAISKAIKRATGDDINIDILSGDVVLLIDLSGKVELSGDLKLLNRLPLFEAKLTIDNPAQLEARLKFIVPFVIQMEGLLLSQVGYSNQYVSLNGEVLTNLKVDQSVKWIGGKQLAGVRFISQNKFTAGNIEKAELSGDVKLFFIDVGVRLDFSDVLSPHLYLRGWNQEIQVFETAGNKKLLTQEQGKIISEKTIVSKNLDYVAIKVESDSGAALFDIVFPDGTVFTPNDAQADPSSSNIDKVFFIRNESANEAFYAIKSPELGEYELRISNAADLGNYNVNVYTPNDKPNINLLSQTSDTTWDGISPITIDWNDSDKDNNAEVSLFYDTDDSGLDGVLIASGINEDDVSDSFTWDINQNIPPSGEYYIYALIDDGEYMPKASYSVGKIKIDNPQAPQIPTNFAVQADDGSVTATWDANPESNLMGYRLFLSENPGDGKYEYDFATGENTTWTIPSLENGKTYEIALVAANTENLESPKTQAITFTPTGNSTGGSPDLTIDVANSTFSSASGQYDGEITVTARLINQGQHPAYTAKIDTYLGNMTKAQLLETTTVSKIEAGEFIDMEYKFNVNDLSDTEFGRRIYFDIRDVQLAELNTRNNIVPLENNLESPNLYDLDGDGDIDVVDITKVASTWNSKQGDANYNAAYDFNGDNNIDIKDIMLIASMWGK